MNSKTAPRSSLHQLCFFYSQTKSSVPPKNTFNEFIIQKLNPLLVVDCRNTALNLTPVTGTTNGFLFQIINSLIESWGVRLTKGARIFQHFSSSWLTYHETAHGNYKVTWKNLKNAKILRVYASHVNVLLIRHAFNLCVGGYHWLISIFFYERMAYDASQFFDLIMFILMLVNYENKL